MLKKSLLLLFGAALLLLPQVSLAHTLKIDQNIGGLLHVDPNDEPQAGSEAVIYVELTDKNGKLTPSSCDCYLEIVNQGKQIYRSTLFSHTATSLSVSLPYTFSDAGVYQLNITGTANGEPLNLYYDLRVDPAVPPENNPNHTGHYIVFGLGGLALIVYFIYDYKKKKLIRKL